MATTTDPAIDALTLRRRARRAPADGRRARGRRPAARGRDRAVRARRRPPGALRAAARRRGAPRPAARGASRRRARDARRPPRGRDRGPGRRLVAGRRRGRSAGRDVEVEPEPVVRVVAALDRGEPREALRRRRRAGPARSSRRPGRSWRSRRRSASRPRADRRSRAPRRCAHRRRPGRPRSPRALAFQVGAPLAERGAVRRGSSRAAPRIASSRIKLRPSGGRPSRRRRRRSAARRAPRGNGPSSSGAARTGAAAHRLEVEVVHRARRCRSSTGSAARSGRRTSGAVDGSPGQHTPTRTTVAGRPSSASADRRGELEGVGRGRRDLGQPPEDLSRGVDRVVDVAGHDRPRVDGAELERGHDAEVAAAAAQRPEQLGIAVGPATTRSPAAVTTSARTRLSQVKPASPTASRSRRRASGRRRPCRRTCRRRPRGGAPRPRRRRPPRAPRPRRGRSSSPGRPRRRAGRAGRPPGRRRPCAWPATLWPPPRTAIGSPRSPAATTAADDIVVERARTMAAGRRWIVALNVGRASS